MRLLSVYWADATSVDEWTARGEIDHSCNLIHIVGIFVEEKNKILTLALNHDTDSDNLSCFIHIPTQLIASREVLRAKKKQPRKTDRK